MKNVIWKKNLVLVILVIILAVVPLLFCKNAEFGGADGEAENVIMEMAPNYKPWFESFMVPASGEIESLLFALQAAIGSGIVFFILGRMTAPVANKNGDRK